MSIAEIKKEVKALKQRYALTPEQEYFRQYRGLSFEQFWEAIGRPEKNDILHPIYPYEQEVYDALQEHKYIWIKKATGLGITEFFLRYMAWLALKDDTYQGKMFAVVTGPNEKIAKELIDRIVQFFPDNPPYHTTTEVVLNDCRVQAFPSNHLDAARGRPNIKFWLLDEADFFRIGEQQNARDVSERYIAKTDPVIVMVSTPNLPDGLFEKIENEKESIYHRMLMPYTKGLGTIYTEEEIAKARKSPSFEREYNLKYGYGIGNVFAAEDIDACTKNEYDLEGYKYATCRLGIDPAFGTLSQNSKFAFCTAAMVDGKIRIYDAEQYAGLSYDDAMRLYDERLIKFNPDKIYVDGANPVFIKGAKTKVGERANYEEEDKEREKWWKVKPIAFGAEGPKMLGNIQSLVSQGYVEIHPRFKDLILQLRMAQTSDKNDGKLMKDDHPMDLFDAFRLALKGYSVNNE